MTGIGTVDEVVADVRSVTRRWLERGLATELTTVPLSTLARRERCAFVDAAAERAIELVDGSASPGGAVGELLIVPKAPHVMTTAGVAAVVARLLAFGVDVRGVRVIGEASHDVANALYPVTGRYFAELPPEPSMLWSELVRRFGVPEFKNVFGRDFAPDLVVPAKHVIEGGPDETVLSDIWARGRAPLPCKELIARYGGPQTCRYLVKGPGRPYLKRRLGHTRLHRMLARCPLCHAPEHVWFGAPLPLGLQRIGPGLMAFALRDERIDNGRPVIVLNGHFPRLARLFGRQTQVITAALPSEMSLSDVRRWVIGANVRAELCQSGSIRGDAQRRQFPVESTRPVDPHANVVHCSDGFLAGVRESSALVGGTPTGPLVDRLRTAGLTAQEVTEMVLADPLVGPAGAQRHLTDATRGLGLDDCVASILEHFPPVFGERNGSASGVRLSTFAGHVAALVAAGGKVHRYPEVVEERRHPRGAIPNVVDLTNDDAASGRRALAAGTVGMLVPAGGTGGRFGGYDLPEDDLRRQKPLAPVFAVAGSTRSALDIRLANALHWRHELGSRLPVAVLGSATNRSAIAAWQAGWADLGVDDVTLYEQRGVHRLTFAGVADMVRERSAERWIDHLARDRNGALSLKPFGALGCLTALALDGIYERWRRSNVEILVTASADDASARLDPRIVGYMLRNGLDAVVVGVPQGFRARVSTPGAPPVELRGDASGWCVDQDGRPCHFERLGDGRHRVLREGVEQGVTTRSIDIGGVISEVRRSSGWGLAVVEHLDPAAALEIGSLFSANQLYLRCDALDPFLGAGPEAVADLVDALPTFAESKVVAGQKMVQFVQPLAGVLRVLDHVGALAMHRSPVDGQRGGFGPVKEPADIQFTQHMLATLAYRDELWFPGQPRSWLSSFGRREEDVGHPVSSAAQQPVQPQALRRSGSC